MSDRVWVVMDCVDSEGGTVVGARRTEDEAKALARADAGRDLVWRRLPEGGWFARSGPIQYVNVVRCDLNG